MSKCILVVDDEVEVTKALRLRLTKLGHEVTCVSSGGEAIKTFLGVYYSRPFDVILLDIGLPDVNGCDVLRTIRQEEELRGLNYDDGVKIVMQTGFKESWMEAFNGGCDDYVMKPYSFEELLEKINEKKTKSQTG
ncbi:MAG: response regulator [Candidatus Omnitrophica bacterium]|nr:response regulator [Candidatus Omnitrophota bacterium]MCK5179287.1 response regulator [Candidatus Omnitrophota bacterium]